MTRLAIVVPCYNEEEILEYTSNILKSKLNYLIKNKEISEDSFILFINDGSKDKTWNLIEEEYNKSRYIYGLNLSSNVGHQNALYAGLMNVKDICDISISIDADLQDDIQVIDTMIREYKEGSDIVYGVRSSRKKDTFFKRNTAQLFYKFMSILGVKTIYNHADFRLMSAISLEALSKYKERNLFLRGIVPLIGYNTSVVTYERKERAAGESKYPLKKMLSFALEGVTSFSTTPLMMIAHFGLIIIIISICAGMYALNSYFRGYIVEGWTSLILSIWFIGGIQLLCMGVLGIYIGKIYKEVKGRPRYNVEKFLHNENSDEVNKYYGYN